MFMPLMPTPPFEVAITIVTVFIVLVWVAGMVIVSIIRRRGG